METGHCTLKRPRKRKLCYATNTESLSKQWVGALTLEDVDKMFDDLDPSSHCEDEPLPSTPLLQIDDSETNEIEKAASPVPQETHQMGPEGDVLHPATRSPSPKLDIDLDIPFKAHAPVKTSSPIEMNMVVEGVEELDNGNNQVVFPILFPCEDEEKEEAKMEPPPTLKPQCNGHIAEHKESHPVKEKAPKKSQTADLEGKRKAPRQDNTDLPVSAERQQPEVAAPKKKSESVHRQPAVEASTRAGRDLTTFLQKLRDASQPKPACPTKPPSPVKAPTLPEPEDEFLILEDDATFRFSIPRKTAITKKQGQTKTSSSDKASSTDKGAKDSPLETAQKQRESEHTNSKLGSQPVSQKIKKSKGKERKKKVTEPENDMDELCTPLAPPAGDLMEQEKPNKKKQRLEKVPSKESDKEEEQPIGTASKETDEQPTRKMEKKTQKSSDVTRSKSFKDGNENATTRKTRSLKGGRKVIQGSGAVKETIKRQSQRNKQHADAEDLGSQSDKDIMNSEAQADEKDKQNRLSVVSEESSSEDSPTLGKRKRKPPGQWWLSCSENTEETKVTDNRPTLKKAKQSKKELPTTTGPSPVKSKKDRVLKKRNQAEPAASSSKNTNKAKEKKTKQNKKRITERGEMADKMKASESVFSATEAEPTEEQQQEEEEVLDQDSVESCPLVLAHRDHSQNSGDQVFQRVYHHVSNEKMSTTTAPISPRGPQEQPTAAEPGKGRGKRTGSSWTVNGMSEDMEAVSPQPQQQGPKPRKERKKQPKQSRTPKNGNMLVTPKPHRGAPVPPLKVKRQIAPKTVKHSLATFKDIFNSVTESPTVVCNRGADQNDKHEFTERPAVEVTVSDCSPLDKSDGQILSMDAGEDNSPSDHEAPQDSSSQPENTRLKPLTSGPASMIELEQYDEDDDLILPSSRSAAVLCASDLCGPPLEPLILQPKDKANVTEWFKNLWSTSVKNGPGVTPDQFDWYFYKGRAMGVLLDLDCGSFCNGKLLLGSYMKKPLWVDHSATTVFNLLTSSVKVTIDCSESQLNAGQSFMVPCGHAYSLQNLTSQPAALYYTRISAESSD